MQLNQSQYELKHEYDLFCCEPKLAVVALSHPQSVVLYPSLATIETESEAITFVREKLLIASKGLLTTYSIDSCYS